MSSHSQELFSKRILVADGDATQAHFMRKFLQSQNFRVDTASTSDDALDILRKDNNYDLVLADVGLLPMNGFNFATAAGAAFPHIRFVLTSNQRLDEVFPALRRSQLTNVFIKTRPFLFDEFLVTVENLLQPSRSVGLQRYLKEPMEIRSGQIVNRDERAQVVDDAMRYFRRFRQYDSEVEEIRLAVEELINNAIFHAFRRKVGGLEKYRATSFSSLEGDEQITVEYGHDRNYLGVSVSDNQGSLDASTVMAKLERQISMEGLMDENGRGLHLTRNLCERMIINLKPGKLTQVILLFSRRPQYFPRPLTINLIPDVLI